MNTSYLTVDEYKRAPTAIDSSNLDYFSGTSNTQAQDAELANVIARASAWINNYCQQPDGLAASVNSETRPFYIGRDGFLRIQPYNFPIIQLQSVQWRLFPTATWSSIDVSNIQVYDRHFETPLWFPFLNGPALNVSGTYAYPVSAPYTPYLDPSTRANLEEMQVTVQYTYINGFPNATLNVAASEGNTTITLDNVTGILGGTVLTIYDGDKTEYITVSGSPSGNVVTLTSPLLFAHNAKVAVSAIPADVKQACIMLVNYLLKERGVNSITMEGSQNPIMQKYDDVRDIEVAKQLLRQYRRVV